MSNPYSSAPKEAFWRHGVAGCDPYHMAGIYTPKFKISPKDKVATAGSCFAQHIAREMRKAGYQILDVEQAPEGLPEEDRQRYGYNMYSGRYGNIYTVAHLRQLAEEAFGLRTLDHYVWEKDGAFYDGMRPNVEPEGHPSAADVVAHRQAHLERIKTLFCEMDIFVFTLGLTEAWIHKKSGEVYPTAPGAIAGTFDAEEWEFRNFTARETASEFKAFLKILKEHRGRSRPPRCIVTVSPVPLTATASDNHVLVATTYSKASLRVAAAQLAESRLIDYFPSFEIINNPAIRQDFFEPNLRSVSPKGVASVMRVFFDNHPPLNADPTEDSKQSAQAEMPLETSGATIAAGGASASAIKQQATEDEANSDEDVVCEDALLDAFS